MSLRGAPVEHEARLPDGRFVVVRVTLAVDPYIPRREVDTVVLELVANGRVEATVNTLLAPEQVTEARRLAADVRTKLESGELPPTAGALEPLADTIP